MSLHATFDPFVSLKYTVILFPLFLLANFIMVWKAVFSIALIHICLYGSRVWGAAGALKLLRHTRPNREHVWAQGLARVTWAWFPQDGLQWGLQQPEGQWNDKNILWSPSRTCPPQPCPFPCTDACFQEDQASCVMEWWMRGGRGGRDKEEETDRERWIGMGWRFCAWRDFGEFVGFVVFLVGTGSC